MIYTVVAFFVLSFTVVPAFAYTPAVATDQFSSGSNSGTVLAQGHVSFDSSGSGTNFYYINIGNVYDDILVLHASYNYIYVKAWFNEITFRYLDLISSSTVADELPPNVMDLWTDLDFNSNSGTISKSLSYSLGVSGGGGTFGFAYGITNTQPATDFTVFPQNIVEGNYRRLGYVLAKDSHSNGMDHDMTVKLRVWNTQMQDLYDGEVVYGSAGSSYWKVRYLERIEIKIRMQYQYYALGWHDRIVQDLYVGASNISPDMYIYVKPGTDPVVTTNNPNPPGPGPM